MAIPRFPIPPLGVLPRPRGTFLTSTDPIPPQLLMDEKGRPRWLAGVQFQQLGCAPMERIESIMCDPGEDPTKTGAEMGEIVAFDTFTIYDALDGSMLCTDIERMDSDIQIRMPAFVSEQFGAELMEGGARPFNPADPLVNPSLQSSASVVAGGPYSPLHALALLEQAAADFLHGAQATMHLTPRGMGVINFLDLGGSDTRGRWTTAQGHIVIADAGYSGPEPDANVSGAADEWWYSSGPVFHALTAFTPLGEPYQRISYANNQLTNIYEGFGIVVFDPCGVVAVPVCYDSDCVTSGS